MSVSEVGLDYLRLARDGIKGMMQSTGGNFMFILFGIGVAVIIYIIFKSIAERFGG